MSISGPKDFMNDQKKVESIKALIDTKFRTEDQRTEISGDEMYDLLVDIDEALSK